MKVAVWDTYVTKKDGRVMHFDIVVPHHLRDESIIYSFGKDYLKSKDMEDLPLTAKEWSLCHVERATAEVELHIRQKGYYIIEMQGC